MDIEIRKRNKFLQRLWRNMQARCGNPKDKGYKYYGGKGIKVKINREELLSLWKRDNASNLTRPSIDRIDSFKNYELSNCRFIEVAENSARVKRASSEKSGENGHIHITFPEELLDGLKIIKNTEDISMQKSIRRAVKNYLIAKKISQNNVTKL